MAQCASIVIVFCQMLREAGSNGEATALTKTQLHGPFRPILKSPRADALGPERQGQSVEALTASRISLSPCSSSEDAVSIKKPSIEMAMAPPKCL